jgi:hypothetical protein
LKFNEGGAPSDLATRPTTVIVRSNQNSPNFGAVTPTLFVSHNLDLKGDIIEDEEQD